MSFFGSVAKLVSKGASLVKSATKIPGIGMIPLLGNVASAVNLASSGMDIYHAMTGGGSGGSGGAGLPAVPGGLPALPMAASTSTTQMPMPMPGGGSSMKTVHLSPMMPTDKATIDAWIAAGLIIPFNALHTAYRAPKGFRVVHVNGMTIAVRSDVARKMHLVAPSHKPPISVGEWHSLKRAQRTIKKVRKIHGLIKMVSDHTTSSGQVKIHHHHKKGAKK